MAVSSNKMPVEEKSSSPHEGFPSLTQSLLDSCKAMLPLVRQHCSGEAGGDAIIQTAERVIARAERETLRPLKSGSQSKPGFFGRIGNHYDFELVVYSIREKDWIIRCEGQDRHGRKMVIRVKKGEEPFAAVEGDTIFFRGRVLAHRALFGEPVTHIEVTSGVLKI